MRVLHISVEFARFTPDVERLLVSVANGLWQVDGLLDTFWMQDGNTFTLQQVFGSDAAARSYLKGPVLKRLSGHPECTDLFIQEFDAVDELNVLSRSETRPHTVVESPELVAV